MTYEKGSEWRKWDLHVHTPESVLSNGFGSDFDAYVKTLFTALIANHIGAVGITDYFTIEGYKKIRAEYLDNDEKLKVLFTPDQITKIKDILVLPNIEFRSDVFVGPNSVNFHVLFAEGVPCQDIEEKFLHEIDFLYQGEPQAEDKKRKLKLGNIGELGNQLRAEHPEFTESDLYTGMMNAVVDHSQVTKILSDKKGTFGGRYLFGVMADEDLSSISWNSRDHQTRKVLIQKSDFLFSSNTNTRNWALGKNPYREGQDKFIAEFKTLKPCIHGSDAHEFRFIGHPCAKRGVASHNCDSQSAECDLRHCWIKADTTFEGLKQVLYEPEDRVIIQSDDPTPVKSSQSLKEFKIVGTTLEPELKLASTSIPLNEGLVAITGGKGGGKTALVDLIDNMYESRAFCDDPNSFVRRVAEGTLPNQLRTEIVLQDGNKHQKEIRENTFIQGASIVYVAQGELDKHVEDPAHLETYINRLVFESNEIRDSELLFDYEGLDGEISDLQDQIAVINKAIFDLENETEPKIEQELINSGKKLENECKDADKSIAELAKGLSKEKIQEAEEKQKQLTALRDKKEQLNELGLSLKDIIKFTADDIPAFNAKAGKANALALTLKFDHKVKSIEYTDTDSLQTFIAAVRVQMRDTIGAIEKFQKDLEDKEKGIKEHSKLLGRRKELETGSERIAATLKIIGGKKTLLLQRIDDRKKLFSELIQKRVDQRDKYRSIIAAFASKKNDILNDLEFTAELHFDKARFANTMSELVDQRKIRIAEVEGSESDVAFFTNAMVELSQSPDAGKVDVIAKDVVGRLVSKLVPNQKRAETISRLTLYDSIFADYLNIVPSVKYKRVKLSKLSLGQKATVLLKIYLAQGANPIIIDSHDDHLDNEFIMGELVIALRQAKQFRQVIVVSNNGNIVVNSDAEQVIIASRNDQGEISYTSGSLENPTLRPKLLLVLEGGEPAFSKRQRKYRLQS